MMARERSVLYLNLDLTFANGLHKRCMVLLGQIGIGNAEARDGAVEDVALADIPGDHRRVGGASITDPCVRF
jgi:hypothetical protein